MTALWLQASQHTRDFEDKTNRIAAGQQQHETGLAAVKEGLSSVNASLQQYQIQTTTDVRQLSERIDQVVTKVCRNCAFPSRVCFTHSAHQVGILGTQLESDTRAVRSSLSSLSDVCHQLSLKLDVFVAQVQSCFWHT